MYITIFSFFDRVFTVQSGIVNLFSTSISLDLSYPPLYSEYSSYTTNCATSNDFSRFQLSSLSFPTQAL